MSLNLEYKTYQEKHQDQDWVSRHKGKYVLIKGDEVIRSFDSYSDALREGYDRFGLEPFLVMQVQPLGQAHFISRYLPPCHSSHSQ